MPYTVENQTIFHINRDMPTKNEGNFIMVKKENLERALKELSPYGAVLYLYLAGNANGYDLAFSPQDVIDRMNIGKTTVHKYIKIMKEKGYLVQKSGNVYDFYEIPRGEKTESGSPFSEQKNSRGEQISSQGKQHSLQGDIEIYNKDINIDKKKISPSESKTEFVF